MGIISIDRVIDVCLIGSDKNYVSEKEVASIVNYSYLYLLERGFNALLNRACFGMFTRVMKKHIKSICDIKLNIQNKHKQILKKYCND